MKQIKRRIIYDNYDLYENYEEDAYNSLLEKGYDELVITEDDLWNEIQSMDLTNYDKVKEELANFFDDGSIWVLHGYVKREGKYFKGTIFTNFSDLYYNVITYCNYVRIYDENGHFYIEGFNFNNNVLYNVEIKKLTQKGEEYLDRWKCNSNDRRTEEYVCNMIMKKYSVLPHFVHNVYGCPKTEYEDISA